MNRAKDMVKRCREVGDDALAIKIADVLDSSNYYLKLKDEKKLKSYRLFIELLIENLSENLKSKFLNDLEKIII